MRPLVEQAKQHTLMPTVGEQGQFTVENKLRSDKNARTSTVPKVSELLRATTPFLNSAVAYAALPDVLWGRGVQPLL